MKPIPATFAKTLLFNYLALFILVCLMGCKKNVIDNPIAKENIQLSEIAEWNKWYQKTIPNAPELIISQAEKTFFQNQFYLRVPVAGSTGMVYFGKIKNLEAVFIRLNPIKQPISYPFTGDYEIIDLNKFSYTRLTYINGMAGQIYKSLSKDVAVKDGSLSVQTNSWFSQFLYCLSQYIVAVPAKINGEWTGCWVLGGGSGENEELQPEGGDSGGGGTSSIDWPSFLVGINPPLTGPDPIPQVWNGTWIPVTPPAYVPPADFNDGSWVITQSFQADQSVCNEPDYNYDTSNDIWWDENISDPNTSYYQQPRPTFSNMYNNYPKNSTNGDMLVPDVCNLIGGQVKIKFDQHNIANACALRVSRALNYSGVTIPYIANQTLQGADGKNYFIYAANLYNWLVKTLGPPEIHKTRAEGYPNGSGFLKQLMGIQNRGIYIMKPIPSSAFTASGHATLWGALDCIGGNNYFAAANDIYIWILPN